MYFRNSKTRTVQSQEVLRATTRRLSTDSNAESIYTQTYDVQLADASHSILLPAIRGMTGGQSAPNFSIRSLHTVGVWANASGDVCRCAFIQPELATATCTIPASKLVAAQVAKRDVAYDMPFAGECRVGPPAGRPNAAPQVSGRMSPYVVSRAGLDDVAVWGFANMCKSRLLFMVSSGDQHTCLCPTRMSIMHLKNYMPEFGVCIYDDDMSCYRITVSPDSGSDTAEPNKNSSLIIYGDGSLKMQGKPDKMERVCSAFYQAVHDIAKTRFWEPFLMTMTETTILERKT